MAEWLYEKITLVPPISDAQVVAMRHIEPVLKVPDSVMYRRIEGIEKIHPREQSFLWDAKPIGPEFTFDTLNQSRIITQHYSSVFFKPSLAEVYAWILVYMPECWGHVQFFCLGEPKRIGGSYDCFCECTVMGGRMLVRGADYRFPGGQMGCELVEAQDA